MAWARRAGYKIDEEELGGEMDMDAAQSFLDGAAKGLQQVVPVYSVSIKLPHGFTPLGENPKGAYAKWIGRMAVRKNLELEDFIRAGVGYTRDGIWEPYAIFPVMEWKHLVYYQGRTYNEEGDQSTKKFPSRKEVPFGSRYWVYNVDRLRESKAKVCIIVESILNVLSLEKELERQRIKDVVPVAIFKHKVSREQAVKLAGCKQVEEFCLMFDEDATREAWKSTLNLPSLHDSRFSVAEMPKGVDANDDARVAVRKFCNRKRASGNSLLASLSHEASKF